MSTAMCLTSRFLAATALASALCGCATRSVDVAPAPASAAEFSRWACDDLFDEQDRLQQRAAEVAWAVDERAGHNILALGVGLSVFWPVLLAMQPDGPQATELAALKGRFEALRRATQDKGCPQPGLELSAARRAALPLAAGERLVYEDRRAPRQPSTEWALQLAALRRGENAYRVELPPGGPWRQDAAGNVLVAPPGALQWPHLLRSDLVLGQVLGGEITVAGDAQVRARMRGQVVAVGPQWVLHRRFDAVVVELFGDVPFGEAFTRVDGAIVVDRASGTLLRLDLRSAHPAFTLQRRLLRVEPAPP